MKKIVTISTIFFTAFLMLMACCCCCGGGNSGYQSYSPTFPSTTAPTTTAHETTTAAETTTVDPNLPRYKVSFRIEVSDTKDYFDDDNFWGGLFNEAMDNTNSVRFYVDDILCSTIVPGGSYEAEYELPEGNHTLKFERNRSSTEEEYYLETTEPESSTESFDLKHDTEIECTLNVSLSNISVEKIKYIDPNETEAETEPETSAAADTESEGGTGTDSTESGATGERDENSIDPALKEYWDSYEACMNRYVDFMNSFYSDPDNFGGMIVEYAQLLAEYAGWVESIEKYDLSDTDTYTEAEIRYMTEVNLRVNEKLLTLIFDPSKN